MDYSSDDVLIGLLPFFHIYGQVVVMLAGLQKGVKTVTMPKFEPEMFLSLSQKYKVNLKKSLLIFMGEGYRFF